MIVLAHAEDNEEDPEESPDEPAGDGDDDSSEEEVGDSNAEEEYVDGQVWPIIKMSLYMMCLEAFLQTSAIALTAFRCRAAR